MVVVEYNGERWELDGRAADVVLTACAYRRQINELPRGSVEFHAAGRRLEMKIVSAAIILATTGA